MFLHTYDILTNTKWNTNQNNTVLCIRKKQCLLNLSQVSTNVMSLQRLSRDRTIPKTGLVPPTAMSWVTNMWSKCTLYNVHVHVKHQSVKQSPDCNITVNHCSIRWHINLKDNSTVIHLSIYNDMYILVSLKTTIYIRQLIIIKHQTSLQPFNKKSQTATINTPQMCDIDVHNLSNLNSNICTQLTFNIHTTCIKLTLISLKIQLVWVRSSINVINILWESYNIWYLHI